MPPVPAPTAVDAANAHFIQGGVSIIVSSRDAANQPNLVRALGCRVARDLKRVTIVVASTQAESLLADIRNNARIAVVFTHPSTHRSLQLKGSDAAVVRTLVSDKDLVAAYCDAMVVELEKMGVSEAHTRVMLTHKAEDLVAIAFTPSSAFVQTPGPDAGAPLRQA
jgi:hypothetical protein